MNIDEFDMSKLAQIRQAIEGCCKDALMSGRSNSRIVTSRRGAVLIVASPSPADPENAIYMLHPIIGHQTVLQIAGMLVMAIGAELEQARIVAPNEAH